MLFNLKKNLSKACGFHSEPAPSVLMLNSCVFQMLLSFAAAGVRQKRKLI